MDDRLELDKPLIGCAMWHLSLDKPVPQVMEILRNHPAHGSMPDEYYIRAIAYALANIRLYDILYIHKPDLCPPDEDEKPCNQSRLGNTTLAGLLSLLESKSALE